MKRIVAGAEQKTDKLIEEKVDAVFQSVTKDIEEHYKISDRLSDLLSDALSKHLPEALEKIAASAREEERVRLKRIKCDCCNLNHIYR